MDKIVRVILIATGNPGKFCEIREVLAAASAGATPMGVRWTSLADLGKEIIAPVEDGRDLAENAALKARYYARASGLWTLADDSGLEVDALGGEPGVRSARYGGVAEGSPHAEVYLANNRRLIAALQAVPAERRTARFRCALAISDGESLLLTAEGRVEGRIIDEPRGTNGFGYDPHFLLPELGLTMAELPPEHKNRISHRGRALQGLREQLPRLLVGEL